MTTVLLVGAGGIGCEFIDILLTLKVIEKISKLIIIDMDIISSSNLERQRIYKKADINCKKAEIACKYIRKFDKNIDCQAYTKPIEELPISILIKTSVIVLAVDNIEARRYCSCIVNDWSIPLINAGTSGFKGNAELYLSPYTGSFHCLGQLEQDEFPFCSIKNEPKNLNHSVFWSIFHLRELLSVTCPGLENIEFSQFNSKAENCFEVTSSESIKNKLNPQKTKNLSETNYQKNLDISKNQLVKCEKNQLVEIKNIIDSISNRILSLFCEQSNYHPSNPVHLWPLSQWQQLKIISDAILSLENNDTIINITDKVRTIIILLTRLHMFSHSLRINPTDNEIYFSAIRSKPAVQAINRVAAAYQIQILISLLNKFDTEKDIDKQILLSPSNPSSSINVFMSSYSSISLSVKNENTQLCKNLNIPDLAILDLMSSDSSVENVESDDNILANNINSKMFSTHKKENYIQNENFIDQSITKSTNSLDNSLIKYSSDIQNISNNNKNEKSIYDLNKIVHKYDNNLNIFAETKLTEIYIDKKENHEQSEIFNLSLYCSDDENKITDKLSKNSTENDETRTIYKIGETCADICRSSDISEYSEKQLDDLIINQKVIGVIDLEEMLIHFASPQDMQGTYPIKRLLTINNITDTLFNRIYISIPEITQNIDNFPVVRGINFIPKCDNCEICKPRLSIISTNILNMDILKVFLGLNSSLSYSILKEQNIIYSNIKDSVVSLRPDTLYEVIWSNFTIPAMRLYSFSYNELKKIFPLWKS